MDSRVDSVGAIKEITPHNYRVVHSFVSEGYHYKEGEWYFQDETETLHGPHKNQKECWKAFVEYCKSLGPEPEH